MATSDVPGFKPSNNDKLAMGCWAEHEDGSLIVVESTENGKVVYSIFDTSDKDKGMITEYRSAMPEDEFKTTFSWHGDRSKLKGAAKDVPDVRWTWHDKTPFDWDRVMGATKEGVRFSSADQLLSAAERVARSLNLRGKNVNIDDLPREQQVSLGGLFHKIGDMLDQHFGPKV